MANYLVSEVEGSKVVTAFVNGQMLIAAQSNPMFAQIVDRLRANDVEGIEDLFNAEIAVTRRFSQLSERVSVANGVVYFDGDQIENELSNHLNRLLREGADVGYLVAFWEKIATNPSEHSRENLLRWLATHDFAITKDGDIVAYKGLRADGTSIHAGFGIVDGVEMNTNLPNKVGSTISINRGGVVANPAIGCAYGLHAGTWDYASNFGHGNTVKVAVNPRDVVSVPTDCNDAKMRVSTYKVLESVTTQVLESVSPDALDNDFTAGYSDSVDPWGVTVN